MFAIVPAYNEAPSVGSVVESLRRSGVFDGPWPEGGVIVVDDGSSDRTAEIAEDAGAMVIRTPKNLGKGGAMLYAYEGLPSVSDCRDDRVAFFDADLQGFEPHHARRLAELSELDYDQVALMQDRDPISNLVQSFMPLITGQRIVRRWVLDALPQTCWSGYCIETAINDVVQRGGGRTATILADGVRPRTKLDKTGLLQGIRGQLKMAKQIRRTRQALRSSDGMTCEL